MKKLLIFIFLLMASPAWATNYYVGATTAGAANCLTSHANNCLLATALAIGLVADDAIHLADGHYTGVNSMMSLPMNVSGSAGQPIVISADNDGEVWIDGQNARQPCNLGSNGSANNYIDIEGINFSDSNQDVCSLWNDSHDNNFRRDVFWDADAIGNYQVISVFDTPGPNLFEDIAAFGSARKVIGLTEEGNNTTLRRVWAQFMTDQQLDPKLTLTIFYKSSGTKCENCIFTWAEQGGTETSNMYSILGADYVVATGEANRKVNVRVRGSIVYMNAGHNFNADAFVQLQKVGDIAINDLAVFVPSDQTVPAINVTNCRTTDDEGGPLCATPSLSLTNVSLIHGTGDSIASQWTQTNVDSASSVAGIYSGGNSLYVNDGTTGATICSRYVDGVLTGSALWPWPMNQRIIDAMTDAAYTTVDVDSDIQSIFGTYPDTCSSGTVVSNDTVCAPNSPCESFDSYNVDVDINGLNSATGFTSQWQKVSGGAITTASSPMGSGTKAITSRDLAGTTKYVRSFTPSTAGCITSGYYCLRAYMRASRLGYDDVSGLLFCESTCSGGGVVKIIVEFLDNNIYTQNGVGFNTTPYLPDQWYFVYVEWNPTIDKYRYSLQGGAGLSAPLDMGSAITTNIDTIGLEDNVTLGHTTTFDNIGGPPPGRGLDRSANLFSGLH